MGGSRSVVWVGVVLVAGALSVWVVSLARVPDPRRYVLDAAGRRVEVRHAGAPCGPSAAGRPA